MIVEALNRRYFADISIFARLMATLWYLYRDFVLFFYKIYLELDFLI